MPGKTDKHTPPLADSVPPVAIPPDPTLLKTGWAGGPRGINTTEFAVAVVAAVILVVSMLVVAAFSPDAATRSFVQGCLGKLVGLAAAYIGGRSLVKIGQGAGAPPPDV